MWKTSVNRQHKQIKGNKKNGPFQGHQSRREIHPTVVATGVVGWFAAPCPAACYSPMCRQVPRVRNRIADSTRLTLKENLNSMMARGTCLHIGMIRLRSCHSRIPRTFSWNHRPHSEGAATPRGYSCPFAPPFFFRELSKSHVKKLSEFSFSFFLIIRRWVSTIWTRIYERRKLRLRESREERNRQVNRPKKCKKVPTDPQLSLQTTAAWPHRGSETCLPRGVEGRTRGMLMLCSRRAKTASPPKVQTFYS